MIKELIISGDAAFQIAFEKFEKGDNDAITQYCKTISARKGSVDLLENMDLDFAFEDKNSTEAFYATVSNTGTRIGVSSSASQRRPSIDTHIRSNSIFGISDTDQPLTAFNSSVFDDNDRHVELSAYAAMAKSLSSSKAAPKSTVKVGTGRTTPVRPSSRGIASTGTASAVKAPIASLRSPLGAAAPSSSSSSSSSSSTLVAASVTESATSRSTGNTICGTGTGTLQGADQREGGVVPTTSMSIGMGTGNGAIAPAAAAKIVAKVEVKAMGNSVTRPPVVAGEGQMMPGAIRAGLQSKQQMQPLIKAPVSMLTSQSKAPPPATSAVPSGAVMKGFVGAGPMANISNATGTATAIRPHAVVLPGAALAGPGSSTMMATGMIGSATMSNRSGATTTSSATNITTGTAAAAAPMEMDSQNVISLTIAGGPLWAKAVEGPESRQFIGAYSPEQRRKRIERFVEKRNRRVWTKKVKYDVRKNFADSRLRIKGRFVKKEDEEIMRELMTI